MTCAFTASTVLAPGFGAYQRKAELRVGLRDWLTERRKPVSDVQASVSYGGFRRPPIVGATKDAQDGNCRILDMGKAK